MYKQFQWNKCRLKFSCITVKCVYIVPFSNNSNVLHRQLYTKEYSNKENNVSVTYDTIIFLFFRFVVFLANEFNDTISAIDSFV